MTSFKTEGWQKRNTMAILGFIGLALMYALRFNLSIGIVAMVDQENMDNGHKNHLANWTATLSNDTICPALFGPDGNTLHKTPMVPSGQNQSRQATKFRWNEKDQGLILGSFFWGYIVTQLPGGMLAQRLGAKWVVSLGLLITGLLSIILPWAAMVGGINLLLTIRILQGLAEGVMFPAFIVLLSKWAPPNERASISSLCFSGMPFGSAVTMIISGHLISNFGWPAVFYVPGIVTIIWFLAWTYFVYSSPDEHPTISASEHIYIDSSKAGDHKEATDLMEIPWKDILLSVPFWAIFVAHFTSTWGHNILHSEGPKYLHSVLHFDIEQNAYIAAAPLLGQMIFSITVTRASDYLVSKNCLSLLTSRRICNTIGQAGVGLTYLGLILAGCDRSLAIIFFILTGTLGGAACGGFLVSPIDISPVYAGVIEGVVNCIANFTGFGAPYVAGLILYNEPTINGWRYVFLIPVIVNLIGNFFYIMFCSTEVQPWNNKAKPSGKGKNSERL